MKANHFLMICHIILYMVALCSCSSAKSSVPQPPMRSLRTARQPSSSERLVPAPRQLEQKPSSFWTWSQEPRPRARKSHRRSPRWCHGRRLLLLLHGSLPPRALLLGRRGDCGKGLILVVRLIGPVGALVIVENLRFRIRSWAAASSSESPSLASSPSEGCLDTDVTVLDPGVAAGGAAELLDPALETEAR
jgi:hypothetical protein